MIKGEGTNIKEYKETSNKILLKSQSTNKANKDIEVSEKTGFADGDYIHLGKIVYIF